MTPPAASTAPDRDFDFISASDGMRIHCYEWRSDGPARGLVVIAHGAAEHALRYGRFARALGAAGFVTWAPDHRGHGQTAGSANLGDFGAGGWDALVDDLVQLAGLARAEHPGMPVALFGHSMGGAAGQQFAPLASGMIDALVLSGTTAREAPPPGAAPPVFAPNEPFEPARTPYDWLSRDAAEVDKYIADPFCGFETRREGLPIMRADPARLADPKEHAKIRPDLPVLLVAGDADPINRGLEGLHLLERWWRAAGVRRIDTLYYAGGRHEMLNETNRGEVTADVIGWLRRAVNLAKA